MPTRPRPGKDVEGSFGRFERLAQRVLAVPHAKIKAELDAEKRRKSKRASRVSRDRG